MSQRNVERVIGRLVTDEQFRARFAEDPEASLREVMECGMELTSVEVGALAGMDVALVSQFADRIDPRIQKVGGCGGSW